MGMFSDPGLPDVLEESRQDERESSWSVVNGSVKSYKHFRTPHRTLGMSVCNSLLSGSVQSPQILITIDAVSGIPCQPGQ